MRGLLATFLGWVLAGFAAAQDRPPNIVLIMADDLGYGDLGCYGSARNETPNIDGLADQGVVFLDFHSSGAMCTPTRAATLTGVYQQRFGKAFDGALSGKTEHDKGLPLEAFTLAEALRNGGYETGCFGKWHLGYQPPFLPPRQGFDEFRGLGSGDGDYFTHVDRSGRPDWWTGEELTPDTGYTTELLTDYSINFIERHRERPFFLYIPHLAIHFPWQGPNDPPHRQPGTDYMTDKFGVIPIPDDVSPHVKAMVEALDKGVGRTLAALEKWGLRENTVVIFTSDNGGYRSYGNRFQNISSNGPLRGQKTEPYEGGHRVPMIISWPGKMEPGITNALGHSTDLFPTIANLADLKLNHAEFDGEDLGPHLLQGKALPERTLYWRLHSKKAVREGPWKLVVPSGKAPPELYHLGKDLSEELDLATQHPERVAEMLRKWDAWEAEVNASAEAYKP